MAAGANLSRIRGSGELRFAAGNSPPSDRRDRSCQRDPVTPLVTTIDVVSASCDDVPMEPATTDWHTHMPAVYLDQWVWIRFARVIGREPERRSDVAVLEAVAAAAERGVVFPLSATHYEETARVLDPRQRVALAAVMAPISQLRTLRSQGDLVRHQLLVAMHEMVGRPAFRPSPPEVLGVGVHWAFRGIKAQVRVLDASGQIQDVDPSWLRHASQFFEAQILAGPGDHEIEGLRRIGYISTREVEERPGNRLAWERAFAEKLKDESPSRAELRVWLLARELMHEYSDLLDRVLREYRLTFAAIAGSSNEKASRRRAVEFAERIPTLRIAADMKLEVFRNPGRGWSLNMLRDIDALSVALPYCRAVIADRDAAALVQRSSAPRRYGSVVTHELSQIPELLEDLAAEASASIESDRAGWDAVGPGEGFRYDQPERLVREGLPPGCVVRLCGPDGPLTRATHDPSRH